MQHLNRAEFSKICLTVPSSAFAGSHCATGREDRLAVRSRSSGPTREGPATECASSVARHGNSEVMSTGGDRNATVDYRYFGARSRFCRHWSTVTASLYCTLSRHVSCNSCDSPWSYLSVLVTRRAVAFSGYVWTIGHARYFLWFSSCLALLQIHSFTVPCSSLL